MNNLRARNLLGLSETFSLAELKTNYRKLSLENHPDKGGSNEKFIEINLAYNFLLEEHKNPDYAKSENSHYNYDRRNSTGEDSNSRDNRESRENSILKNLYIFLVRSYEYKFAQRYILIQSEVASILLFSGIVFFFNRYKNIGTIEFKLYISWFICQFITFYISYGFYHRNKMLDFIGLSRHQNKKYYYYIPLFSLLLFNLMTYPIYLAFQIIKYLIIFIVSFFD